MKTIILLCVCILFAGNVGAQSQTEEELFDLLNNGKYAALVNKVCALREKEYYKNAFMDYCLAYGYCRLKKPSISGEWFDHILKSYNSLSTNKRAELIRLKQNCTADNPTPQATNSLFGFLRGMSSEGFEGNQAGIESKMGIPSLRDTVEELDFEHLTFDTQNRKFTRQQKKEALIYYQKILANPGINVDTTSHFLVFYPADAFLIRNHIEQLENYYSFYSRIFNLQGSNRLITIFYCTSRTDFNEFAHRVHNIRVPKSTYGYASSIDLVMLGIANETWLGAMKHELFHLMIRSFVGDIPPWLDEGTACYFESSTLRDNSITTNLSRSNYRINLLLVGIKGIKYDISIHREKDLKIPSIRQLTNYDWQEFSGKPGDLMIKASFHQSLSYAFVSYLQEKNLLSKTIAAFRNRSFRESPSTDETDDLIVLHLRSNDELLENVTGMSISEIQSAFELWCKGKDIYLK